MSEGSDIVSILFFLIIMGQEMERKLLERVRDVRERATSMFNIILK